MNTDDNIDLPQNHPINKEFERSGFKDNTKKKNSAPVYRMVGSQKIPVAKSAGSLWKARYDHCMGIERTTIDAWKEAFDYYNNAAVGQRSASDGTHARNNRVRGTTNDSFAEIENIIFAHTAAIVPHVYSQNPTIEITATKPENEPVAKVLEELARALLSRTAQPSIQIKALIRKMIVCSILAKMSYAVVTWTQKEQSSEKAIEDLRLLGEQYAEAKTTKEIRDVEGKLLALEETIDALSPSGPKISFRLPWEVLIDPSCRAEDNSDANWMMVADMLPWSYVKATYGYNDDETKTFRSIYQPSHVLRADAEKADDMQINDFQLLNDEDAQSAKAYGFDDDRVFEQSQYVKVWTVYDRTTRRIYMYNEKDWSWPLWVWEDPYNLQGFFNVVPMSYYTSPVGVRRIGEVSYVLDQQDALNESNDAFARGRHSALHNLAYNKNKVTSAQVSDLLNPGKYEAIGLDMEPGEKLRDHIDTFNGPAMNSPHLFDKSGYYNVIDRLLGTTDVMRGAQFRTNTTNDAVEAVTSVAQTRIDEKIDITEDVIGKIVSRVLEMCVQFLDQSDIQELLGDTQASAWPQMTPNEFARDFSLQVVGGSTAKPTSAVKRKQAIEIGQILGQFVQASPVALLVALRVMSRAFDEVVIDDEDWKQIHDSIEQQINAQGGGEGGGGDQLAEVEELINQLPDEAKQALGTAIARGAPIREAVEKIIQQVQATQQQQQTATNPKTET